MFKWIKKGLIFSPSMVKDIIGGGHDMSWMYSHTQCPFTMDLGNTIRVYFSTRENYANNLTRANGGWVELDKNNLFNVLEISTYPMMKLGNIGEFDEFGVMPNSIIKINEKYYLYFCGWSRNISTPYSWEIGIAESDDGKFFHKIGKGPIIGPTLQEPYLHACPQIYYFNNKYYMYYLSGQKWIKDINTNKLESQYLLVCSTSNDGINWHRNPTPIIKTKVANESQTSAAIFNLNNIYHMFFCYREGLDFRENKNKSYRIGYAYSNDLINWIRDDDKAGIDVSDSGWDSQMICYPHITKINNKYIMFYCGNNFGKDGFGYAELELNEGF